MIRPTGAHPEAAIVIEGLDGSGKQTQAGLLRASLIERGADLRSVSFPDTVAPRRRWCACTWAGGSAPTPAT